MSKSLARSSLAFSFMTLLSRILGFVRDMAAAFIFGASPGYDAFLLAFRIPNLLRRLFAEGAFSQAFVPVLSDYASNNEPAEVRNFVDNIAGNLALVLAIITLLGIIAAPYLVYVFAPGFAVGSERGVLAASMLRLTFPYIFFISLTALAGGLLNTRGNFAVPAFTPVLLNISMIIASCYFAPYFSAPELALAWGVMVAGVVQLLFQLPFLYRLQMLPRPRINWSHPAVRRVLLLLPPAIFAAAISQITIMIDSWFASFLPVGSISWLYYADRLMEFPLGMIGVGVATVMLPNLSKHHAKANNDSFNQTLDWGLRSTLLLGVPAMLGLFYLAGPLVATLFQSGNFKQFDAVMTQQALFGYSLAVIGIMLAKVYSSAFYAVQDIKTPLRVSIIILALNLVLNAIFIKFMAHVGLALATSLSSLVNAALLAWNWRKRSSFLAAPRFGNFCARVAIASVVMVVTILLLTPELEFWFSWSRLARIVRLSSIIAAGGISYSMTLLLCGLRPRDFAVQVAT